MRKADLNEGSIRFALPEQETRFYDEHHCPTEGIRKEGRRKLRVCMLSYSFYDQDARVTRYAETLARRDDNVDVVSLGRAGQSVAEQINLVNVFRIQKREHNEKGRLSYLIRLFNFFVKSAFFVSRRHLRNRYDVIHVHSVPDFEVFAAWLPKFLGAKVILDIHDIVPEFYASKFKKSKDSILYKTLVLVEKLSAAFSNHVIISNHLWLRTISRSVKGNKVSAIMNYPDQSIFYRRPRTRSDGRFILIYPGSLNWHQGLDIAIRAVALIKDQVPLVQLHIYGSGNRKEFLLNLIVQLELQDRVFIYDMVPKEQIAEIMSNADLGIVPKRDDPFGGEAFSTKTLEFMCLGVPVLVAATKIDQYYFNDSVVKFFKPGDESDLADKMLTLSRSEEERQRLVINATRFLPDYTWENKKDLYLDLIDSLAGFRS
jgi:glycosyltransferase involved in cell wall biosynthesis